MKYVLIALFALAAYEASVGHFQQAVLCLIVASGALVDAPMAKKPSFRRQA
jgi:hypothetical protein